MKRRIARILGWPFFLISSVGAWAHKIAWQLFYWGES